MRPYFKSSIADLERLFDQVSSDRQGLQALASELDHRSTERAGILSRRVQTALDGLAPPLHKAVAAAPVSSEPFAPSVEPEPSARELVALMDGLQIQWLYDPHSVDMAALVAAHLDRQLMAER